LGVGPVNGVEALVVLSSRLFFFRWKPTPSSPSLILLASHSLHHSFIICLN
jgi:hypothetical protein